MTGSNRRDFLKSQALAATAAAAGISIPIVAQAQAKSAATPTDAAIRWDKAPCRFCGTGCAVMVGVQDGKVVATQGDPEAVHRLHRCGRDGAERHALIEHRPGSSPSS